jgi:hypothetical protein
MPRLVCAACGAQEAMPRHCGRPMQVGTADGAAMLVCWMGPDCGKQAIPVHCGAPMTVEA